MKRKRKPRLTIHFIMKGWESKTWTRCKEMTRPAFRVEPGMVHLDLVDEHHMNSIRFSSKVDLKLIAQWTNRLVNKYFSNAKAITLGDQEEIRGKIIEFIYTLDALDIENPFE